MLLVFLSVPTAVTRGPLEENIYIQYIKLSNNVSDSVEPLLLGDWDELRASFHGKRHLPPALLLSLLWLPFKPEESY